MIFADALELVAPHCDIEERLVHVPETARVRGMFFGNIHAALERVGKLAKYRRYFPREKYSMIPYYPLRDYLLRIAVAGAIYRTPKTLHEGMFEITRGHADTFMSSILGRVLLRFYERNPIRVSEQGLAARRQSLTYGQ